MQDEFFVKDSFQHGNTDILRQVEVAIQQKV